MDYVDIIYFLRQQTAYVCKSQRSNAIYRIYLNREDAFEYFQQHQCKIVEMSFEEVFEQYRQVIIQNTIREEANKIADKAKEEVTQRAYSKACVEVREIIGGALHFLDYHDLLEPLSNDYDNYKEYYKKYQPKDE